MTKIVTRFAPSPTGSLHIGGARTALFNWLFARHHGGKFLMRIEDTDQVRSTKEAKQAIFDGMQWLGLDTDGPVIMQSQQIERHQEIVKQLLTAGNAYPCFMTAEELAAEKLLAREQKRRFYSPWRDKQANERPADKPFVVRLKAPIDGTTIIFDKVQGQVELQNQQLDDLVLLRSDGSATYMLAVVVDDHDMGITHIIRGDDHLVNAARQILVYQAMNWQVPKFAHIPLIHGPDGKKLSKRHGALGIDAYKAMGYLPEAIVNYLLRLGWSDGDKEFFSIEQAISAFSLSGINKGPSRLDFDKMAHVNSHYIKNADQTRLAELVFEYAKEQDDKSFSIAEQELVRNALPHLLSRVKLIPDILTQTEFLTQNRPIEISEKGKKQIDQQKMQYLGELRSELNDLSNWNENTLQSCLKEFASKQGIGFGKFGPILRLAVTGGKPSPDLAVLCYLLGRKETLSRIDDLLDLEVK
ncbi:glutamate--tRNA ligase [Oceanicaulis sp. AH-315-P02]|nr:glutamate--tRNA ligase [Robiginitomaculum sp.]MBN4047753.1 glutamate--tRNA ligase [Oceanicaulis sp. AH-315-P02]